MAVALSACGGSSESEVVGAGSTAQEAAQNLWIEGFEEEEPPPSAKVSYEAVGSARGRSEFIAGDVAYAATDTPLEGRELRQAVERCKPGQLVEIPAYLSYAVIVFNLGKTSSIHLTPGTLARILDGEITHWRDPEIRGESPWVTDFRGPITVFYPAGKSGTTANFTEYLSEAAPGVWGHDASESWPASEAGVAVEGDAGVASAVSGREGAIGVVDASQAGELGLVAIKTGKAFRDRAAPGHGTSIGVLERSPEARDLNKSPYMFPVDLERPVAERGNYPIVLISYLLACTRYESDEEAAAVRALLGYAIDNKGQEAPAESFGVDLLLGESRKRAETAVNAIE